MGSFKWWAQGVCRQDGQRQNFSGWNLVHMAKPVYPRLWLKNLVSPGLTCLDFCILALRLSLKYIEILFFFHSYVFQSRLPCCMSPRGTIRVVALIHFSSSLLIPNTDLLSWILFFSHFIFMLCLFLVPLPSSSTILWLLLLPLYCLWLSFDNFVLSKGWGLSYVQFLGIIHFYILTGSCKLESWETII